MQRFGIDIGGTGIKGAPVDIERGELAEPRWRILTPQPATPEAMAGPVADLVKHFGWQGPVGAAFPAVIKNGVARSAANVDQAWIGTDVSAALSTATGCPVTVLNDADAAGVAEMTYGVGRDARGLVILCTLGTGIGSAMFLNGELVPNTELGHLEIDGVDAELRASDAARDREGLSWSHYSRRLDRYLQTLEKLFSPDLFIIGGGASKKSEKFLPRLNLQTQTIPAALLNNAGIVGAALAAVPATGAPGDDSPPPPGADGFHDQEARLAGAPA